MLELIECSANKIVATGDTTETRAMLMIDELNGTSEALGGNVALGAAIGRRFGIASAFEVSKMLSLGRGGVNKSAYRSYFHFYERLCRNREVTQLTASRQQAKTESH